MTVKLDSLKEKSVNKLKNKKNYICRLNFSKFIKKNKQYNNKEDKFNIKTALINNEVYSDDDDDDYYDKDSFFKSNVIKSCHNLKLHKSNKENIHSSLLYKHDEKKKNKDDYDESNTRCSVTDVGETDDEDNKSKYFYYKNKTLKDYNVASEKKKKKKKWFGLRRKKKKKNYVMIEKIKYLNDSVCSNYNEKKNDNIYDTVQYGQNRIIHETVNSLKSFSTWLF
ncbi:conserved protein, unknown function [Hepatocystis sp. ex Piliocolobus tephrosceles]|nr:conserved protein, unknown function [Hepatocystis sp. ex Piliocolobus tephrosceles]